MTQDKKNDKSALSFLENSISGETVKKGGLNFSEGFTYQNQDLDNVQNSPDEIRDLNHKKMENFIGTTISTAKPNEDEVRSYITSLSSEDRKIYSNLLNEGYAYNDIVAYISNKDKFKNPTATGNAIFEENPSTWQGIAQGPIDTVTRPVRWMFNKASDASDWMANKLGVDEETIARNHTDFDELLRLPNADRESFEYDASELLSDLGMTELITSALAGPIGTAGGWMLRAKKIKDFVTKYPKLMKYLGRFSKGVEDMTVFDLVEGETPNGWSQLFGGGVNMLLEAVGGKSIAGLKGIMNKSDAMNVLKSLANNGLEKVDMTLEQLGEFFNKIGAKGTRRQILKTLNDWKGKVMNLKDELLSVSDDLFKSEEATQILNQLFEGYSKHPGSEGLLKEIKGLMSKTNEYTLKQLEKIRTMWQDSPLNPYLKNVVKETKDAWGTPGSLNLYNSLRKTIKEGAEMLGIGDIGALNKEIQVTTEAIKGIENKILGDQLKKELATYTTYGTLGGLASLASGGDFKKGALMGLGIKGLFNLITKPTIRSYISDAIFKMEGGVKKELTDFIGKGEKLSEEAYDKLVEIISKAKGSVKDEIMDYLSNFGMGTARVATEKAPETAYEKGKEILGE